MSPAPSDLEITSLLREATTIAIVGMSPKTQRPSNTVATYLRAHGYRIIPVNPGHREIMGLTCYPELDAISEPIDIVDIFRRSSEVGPLVDQAVAAGARAVWMQQGIVNEEAAAKALKSGLLTVMDRCIKIEHRRLIL